MFAGSAGVTWLLSSKVVQMGDMAWLEHLQAFSQQLASAGQQLLAEQGHLTDWFTHQQGLFALGDTACLLVFIHSLIDDCI